MEMTHWLDIIVRMTKEVAEVVSPLLGTDEAGQDVGNGAGGDVTKRIDELAEETIIAALRRTGEPMKIVTEERGVVFVNVDGQEGDAKVVAIVDPIDGSYNATRNIPFLAVSIAIAEGSRLRDVTDAAVLNVSTGDLFSASRGVGAWFNGKLASVNTATKHLPEAAMGLDINPKKGEFKRSDFLHRYADLYDTPKKIRVLGSNALEACLVASGALDCFVDVRGNLRLFDIAAAWLIVREAGGHVFELRDGKVFGMEERELSVDQRLGVLAASSLAIRDEVIALLGERFKQARHENVN